MDSEIDQIKKEAERQGIVNYALLRINRTLVLRLKTERSVNEKIKKIMASEKWGGPINTRLHGNAKGMKPQIVFKGT